MTIFTRGGVADSLSWHAESHYDQTSRPCMVTDGNNLISVRWQCDLIVGVFL